MRATRHKEAASDSDSDGGAAAARRRKKRKPMVLGNRVAMMTPALLKGETEGELTKK